MLWSVHLDLIIYIFFKIDENRLIQGGFYDG